MIQQSYYLIFTQMSWKFILQDNGCITLCCIIYPCCLSILYIIVYIFNPPPLSCFFPHSVSPQTISLFSIFGSPFLFWYIIYFVLFYFILFYFIYFIFCLFRTTPAAYGGSQARGQIEAVAASLRQSHSNTGSEPRLRPTYTTAHGSTGSLTHEARPRIEPTSL